MTILTKDGSSINVDEWLPQMRENVSFKRDIFERTPISKNAHREYFWWDEDSNPLLNKQSVKDLIKFIKNEKEK